MKILQVCTLITPDGAFGGPVRVAVNQTKALIAAGHDVTLLAGAEGFGKVLPTEYDGVPVKLFRAIRAVPGTGFAGLMAPGLSRYLLKQPVPDVVHVHLARDLVTLPVAIWARTRKIPYVLQTHGMIDPSSNPLARPLDALLTRPALSGANSVFYLTDVERDDLGRVCKGIRSLKRLQNGVPLAGTPASRVDTASVEVLFLARMHTRKRPRVFIDMARKLAPKHINAVFALVGPDEGEGPACRDAIQTAALGKALIWEGATPPEQALERLEQASIYVLPSINEPFPMSVLEAMSLGKPVVVTDTCGLATEILNANAGLVVNDSQGELEAAVSSLIEDASAREAMGRNAYNLAHNTFGMRPVVDLLAETYIKAASVGLKAP